MPARKTSLEKTFAVVHDSWGGGVLLSDVSEKTNVTRPTAWRYLEDLYNMGAVYKREEIGLTGKNRIRYYCSMYILSGTDYLFTESFAEKLTVLVQNELDLCNDENEVLPLLGFMEMIRSRTAKQGVLL